MKNESLDRNIRKKLNSVLSSVINLTFHVPLKEDLKLIKVNILLK